MEFSELLKAIEEDSRIPTWAVASHSEAKQLRSAAAVMATMARIGLALDLCGQETPERAQSLGEEVYADFQKVGCRR
eukprot:1299737-Alexandrium_andersonii.AAC.1